MNQLFKNILSYIFGIIVVAVQAQKNEGILPEKYSNTINSRNSLWANIFSNQLESENKSLFYSSNVYIKNIKKDFSSILIEFGKIENKFDNLINLEETKEIRRFKRSSSPENNRNECTITKDELIELKNEIENTLQLKHSHFIDNKCNLYVETVNCSELINLMKCGIQHIKHEFIEIMNSNELSPNDITNWKKKYEKLNKSYIKLEDNLNRSMKQKYKLIIDELNQELQQLKDIINKLEQDLQAANENIIQITIELCSSEIHSKKVHQCVEKFNQLTNVNNTYVMNKIINRSFMYITNNEMIIIDYIIDFINSFDSELKYNGYEKLYEIMNIQNILSTPYVFTFASKAQNYPKYDLKMHVINKIDEWSKNIINGNFRTINAYAEKQDFSFCYYLQDIITNAYSNNIINAKYIIIFLDNLPSSKQKALGYYILYNEIALKHGFNGNEIIMLVYRIKEIIDHNSKFNELEINVKQNLQKIKSALPSWIKALLWDNYVSIRSKFNNYKLVSLHKYFGFIYIDTILAICPSSFDGADKWKITAQEKGSYFKINNIDSNHDKVYNWKINAYNNGEHSYFINKDTGNKLYTKDTIGGWIGFWYAIPKDCYQIYEDNNDIDFQQWLIY